MPWAKQNRFASEIYQFASEILASQAKSSDGLSRRQHAPRDSGRQEANLGDVELVRRVVQNDGLFTSPRLLWEEAGLPKPYDRTLEPVRPITRAPHPTSPREGAGRGEGAIFALSTN